MRLTQVIHANAIIDLGVVMYSESFNPLVFHALLFFGRLITTRIFVSSPRHIRRSAAITDCVVLFCLDHMIMLLVELRSTQDHCFVLNMSSNDL